MRRATCFANNLDPLAPPEPFGLHAHSAPAELGRAAPAEACQSLQSSLRHKVVTPEVQQKKESSWAQQVSNEAHSRICGG